VAILTAQITLLLLLRPLSDYLSVHPPLASTEVPTIATPYQALHDLVSNVAYISICIRLSDTIIFLNSIMLGTLFDFDEHREADLLAYKASKAAVEAEIAAEVAARDGITLAGKKVTIDQIAE